MTNGSLDSPRPAEDAGPLLDAADHQALELSGPTGGSLSDPPLVDVPRDIASGTERGRAHTGGLRQGVVFPSPGWGRDFYGSSMGRLARVCVV